MELAKGTQIHNFTIESVEAVPEIEGTAYRMRHATSKARLLFLQNDDIDKAFSISFRTPPKDNTGVFHILEHSVLCGSEKFPVKEPFVNLLKTSMQTFLNAMTFSDKTMYPVASTNEQDLINLADVYLDAVLNPDIYRKKTTFQQEGWHYEFVDDGSGEPHLVYNGVVFNEMKGALSDPQSVLFDELQRNLFPDTPYAFESGGTPEAIPTLTYEAFLDEHRAHYRLDNSYITLYGNMDIDRMLAFLDEAYLTPIGPGSPDGPFPRELTLQQPVRAVGKRIDMYTSPDNACAALGYCLGEARDRQRLIAIDVLLDALVGSNEAPLKRVLLDAGLAADIHAAVVDGMLQPFAMLELRGAYPDAFERFQPLVEATLSDIVESGIDSKLIEASLSHSEFIMREHDFGYSDGVLLSVSALSGWLYDDEKATTYLRYQDSFENLRSMIGTGYFENLVREVFLENDHMASVELVPVDTPPDMESAMLSRAEAALDDDARAAIAHDLAVLREAQEAPDAPEAIAKLPQLTLADIADAPPRCNWELDESKRFPCVKSDVATHGIVYVNRYYDADNLAFEDLPYLSILCMVLGKLDTASYSAAEIDVLVQSKLGDLSFIPTPMTADRDINDCTMQLAVLGSCLEGNIADFAQISNEIMVNTDFSDTARIRTILEQRKVAIEQMFLNAGHAAALQRVASYCKPAGVASEALSGVDFYRFLRELLNHYDERSDELSQRLAGLCPRIFDDTRCCMGFGGDAAAYDAVWDALAPLDGISSDATVDKQPSMVIPAPVDLHEAFAMPGDVTYSALGYDRRLIDGAEDSCTYGTWKVIAQLVGLDYLWNEVRVKGGAYGTGMKTRLTGETSLYSFRDPHITQTFASFAEMPRWLAAYSPSSEELEGYLVSSVADIDNPKKAKGLVRKNDSTYLLGRDKDFELKIRNEILAVTAEDIRAAAPALDALIQRASRCTFGSAGIIDAEQTDFKIVRLFDED